MIKKQYLKVLRFMNPDFPYNFFLSNDTVCYYGKECAIFLQTSRFIHTDFMSNIKENLSLCLLTTLRTRSKLFEVKLHAF